MLMNRNTVTETLDYGGKATDLNHPVYVKDVLTSQWKTSNMLHWGREYALVSIEEEKPVGSFQIDKNQILQGKTL